MFIKPLIISLLTFLSFPALSQIPALGTGMGMETPVQWSSRAERVGEGDTVRLIIEAEVEEGWHLYSQHHRGMALPLEIKLAESGAYESLTGAVWSENPRYEEHYDEYFKQTEFYLSGKARFENLIRVKSEADFTVSATAEGQACRDGSCVPVSSDFTYNIRGYKGSSSSAKPGITDKVSSAGLSGGKEINSSSDINPGINDKKDSALSAGEDGCINHEHAEESLSTAGSQGVDGTSSVTEKAAAGEEEESLWLFFLLSFGGGVVALLTPCVFPVIPMTVSYFMKHGGVRQAVFYGLSIIFIFLVFGLMFSAIFGQDSANYISTHWLPNVLFALVFLLFAFSLFGYFEIRLPAKWINDASAAGSSKAGYFGTFLMALALVLASFSCTIPIAGTVILNAADGGFVKPLIGMLGFSLAFALPFSAFAMFPSLLAKLPRSGSWMNTLKVTLAFIELAFALKFLSVPDQTYHWGLLDREVYLALWIVIFAMLGFYLLGKIRFPLDGETKVVGSPLRLICAIASFAFVVYMIPGLFGAPLNAISGWLPPMYTQDFRLDRGTSSASGDKTIDLSRAFAGELHPAGGIDAYFDYDEARAAAVKENKPLLLIFSGHGCVNCRKMEQMVLSDEAVRSLLESDYVVAELFVDDKVLELPEHLRTVSEDGEPIKLLGRKNIYIQSSVYGYNSQPCYIIADPSDGSRIAEPIFYETSPAAFVGFLQKGKEAFAGRSADVD